MKLRNNKIAYGIASILSLIVLLSVPASLFGQSSGSNTNNPAPPLTNSFTTPNPEYSKEELNAFRNFTDGTVNDWVNPRSINPVIERPNEVIVGKCASDKDKYCPLAPLPNAAPASGTTFNQYVSGIFTLGISLAGVLAIFMIILGGFIKMTSDSVTKQDEAKGYITNAIWGLVIALVSVLLLNLVNPDLTVISIFK